MLFSVTRPSALRPPHSFTTGTRTTIAGGGADGLGVVFKLSPRGKETALHAFAGEPDGAWPEAGVVFGAKDRLIGTAYAEGPDGWGTVFAVAP